MSDRKRNRALIDSDSDDSDGSANLDDVSESFFVMSSQNRRFHHIFIIPTPPNKRLPLSSVTPHKRPIHRE